MSADTTMAILKTRRYGCPPGQYEFRVALVQAVENAWPEPEAQEWDHSELTRQWWLKEAFGRAQVYRNAKAARRAARRKAYRYRRSGGILEYGVRTVDLSSQTFPLATLEQLTTLMRERRVWPFHRG